MKFFPSLVCLSFLGAQVVWGQAVVINEIMYHPTQPVSGAESVGEEFIELFNRESTNVNLSGWRITGGIDFAFPSNTVIASGKLLVVVGNRQAFQAKYPGVTNIVGDFVRQVVITSWNPPSTNFLGVLSNARDTINLETAGGQRIDSVSYADEGDWATRQRGLDDQGHRGWIWSKPHDGGGKSLELIHPNLPNEHGQSWGASTPNDGTPGQTNSVLSTNIAPLVLNVSHAPAVPRSTDNVSLRALVLDERTNNVTVTLHYRVDSATPPPFGTASMFDDGAHGDGASGDRIFGVVLPPFSNNVVVEFYVEASDGQGNSRTWPAPAIDAEDLGAGPLGQVANALFQVDDYTYNLSAPLYKIILTASEMQELADIFNGSPNSDAQVNATFISQDGTGTEVHYLAGIRNRGHGTRFGTPHNYRVNFRSDDVWKGVAALNLNARFVHAQHFGSTMALKSGATGPYTHSAQLRVNNGAGPGGTPSLGRYAAKEVVDGDWAERHFPLDSGGDVYAVVRDLPPNPYPNFDYRGVDAAPYKRTYVKESNVSEDDWTDIAGMLEVMGENQTNLFTTARARQVINVEQWLTHLAVMNLLGNRESGLNTGNNDDYSFYRGVNDPRFIFVFHDMDTVVGQGDSSFPPDYDIFRATCCPVSGDSEGSWRAMNWFMHWPDFEPIYYRTLQRLLDTTFSAGQFDPLIDQTLGDYVPVNTRNAMKNWMNQRRAYVQSVIAPFVTPASNTPVATISGEPRSPTPLTTATLTISGAGITHYRYRLNNGTYSSETPVGTPIVLSGLGNGSSNIVFIIGKDTNNVWQSTNTPTASRGWLVNTAWPTVRINEVLARNDSAVNHFGTFPDLIELYNEGTAQVDLSGMRLTDDPADPNKFLFPPSTVLAAGAYLVLYANNPDGTPGFHLGFTLDAEGDGVYLYHRVSSGGALLDSVQFGLQLSNLSIGRLGAAANWLLTQPTFGGANNAQPLADSRALKINEWLASGLSPYPSDFIELYNPASLPVNLSGLYLTDQPIGAPRLHAIVPLSFIGGNGYTVFTADGDSDAGPDHVNFRLSSDQGEIALLTGDGSVIDCVIYGPQRRDVSFGRCPNGATNLVSQPTPTPGAPNFCPPPPPGPVITTLIRGTNAWKYEQSGTDLGTNWLRTDYDDSSWSNGLAILGVEDCGCLPEAINTPLTFRTPRQVTYYFRTWFNFDTNQSIAKVQLTHVIDDGAVFYVNGREVWRFNMGAAFTPVFYTDQANPSVGNASYIGPIDIPLTNFVHGSNLVAVEVHQNNPAGSTDLVFGMKLEGTIVTNSAAAAGIVINEVLAKNATVTEINGRTPDWIELYNPSSNAVDLAGMALNDELVASPKRWFFPPGAVLGARAYMVIYCDGDLPPSTTNTGFGLKANGGSVFLFKKVSDGGDFLDKLDYGLQTADLSLGRVPSGSTNWVLSLPTAGAENIEVTLGNPMNLRVNEWMADPASGDDWFEIYNADTRPVALGRLHLTDRFDRPTQYPIPNYSFIGTRSNAFQRFEADEPTLPQGPEHVNFKLSRTGDSIFIIGADGATQIDAITFGLQQLGVSEGRLPDGETYPVRFPQTSTPGDANFLPLTNIVVNEALTHTDLPLEDAIELHNTSGSPVNISGWWLSDDKDALQKFQIPAGTPAIPPGGFKVFYENQFNNDSLGIPFSLSSANGDQVYLAATKTNGAMNGLRAIAKFGPAENGVSFGRYRTSVGVDFVAMSQRTFGQDNPLTVEQFRTGAGLNNAYPKIGSIVISEIMYHPPDIITPTATNDNVVEEFIELRNPATTAALLYDPSYPTNTWRLRDAVDFEFPPNRSIAANGYLLVVSFDPSTNAVARQQFQSRYGTNSVLVGPYRGKLDNGGERIELYKPDPPQTNGEVPYVLVEKIEYGDRGAWPTNADGFGLSLQRISATGYGNDPTNWIAATPTPGPSGILDTDSDGMDDNWEMTHFGNLARDGSGDFDADGMTDFQEYIAGTDPRSANSNLRIAAKLNSSVAELRFSAVAGKTYTVLYASTLSSATWNRLADVAAQSTNGVVLIQDSYLGAAQRFYRVVTPMSQ